MWFPDWPLRRCGVSPDEPAQAVDTRNRVAAVNIAAATAGIRPGMRRREAEAICPVVTTFPTDPAADAATFEGVAGAVEALVPRVEIVAPGLLFVPIGGATAYYGGEVSLVERVVKEVDAAAGPGARIGVAGGPFAAQRAAEQATADDPLRIVTDDAAFLRSLDVGTLEMEDLVATFRWLGITTLGELAGLPREAMASRFGSRGLAAHRLAHGQDRMVAPRQLPDDLAVEERFVPPLDNLEQAAFVARSLANALYERMIVGGGLPHRLVIEGEAASGSLRTRTWRSRDPFDEAAMAERVRWQLRAWVEGGGIAGGLVRLRIAPADVSDRGRQLGLQEDAAAIDAAERALLRTQSLLGPDAVLQARPQGGRDPGERVRWYRWGEPEAEPLRDLAAPWPGRLPSPAPALVPDDLVLLEVEWDGGMPARIRLGARWEPVLSWAGPWRRTGRWWEGEQDADRYQLVTSVGAFLCEVRAARTYLVGVYD